MGAWAFLLIGVAIGAGIATVWFDGVETRLRAEIDALRGYLSLMGNVTVLRPELDPPPPPPRPAFATRLEEARREFKSGAQLRKDLEDLTRSRRPW